MTVTFDPNILTTYSAKIPEAQKNLIRLVLIGESFVNPVASALATMSSDIQSIITGLTEDLDEAIEIDPDTGEEEIVSGSGSPGTSEEEDSTRVFRVYPSGHLDYIPSMSDIVTKSDVEDFIDILNEFKDESIVYFLAHCDRISGAKIPVGHTELPNIAQLLSVASSYNSMRESIRNSTQEKSEFFSPFFGGILEGGEACSALNSLSENFLSNLRGLRVPKPTFSEYTTQLSTTQSSFSSLISTDNAYYSNAINELIRYGIASGASGVAIGDTYVQKLFDEVIVTTDSRFDKNLEAVLQKKTMAEIVTGDLFEAPYVLTEPTAEELIAENNLITSGIHGVTGEFVGTTNVQTFENKTISSTLNTVDANQILTHEITVPDPFKPGSIIQLDENAEFWIIKPEIEKINRITFNQIESEVEFDSEQVSSSSFLNSPIIRIDASAGSVFRVVLTDDALLEFPKNALAWQEITIVIQQAAEGDVDVSSSSSSFTSYNITLDTGIRSGNILVDIDVTPENLSYLRLIYNPFTETWDVLSFVTGLI